MLNLLAALLPSTISAIKEILKKKNPEVANTIDKILSDPQTRIELEKIALEKAKLEQNLEKWQFEDRQSARELAMKDVMSDSWLSKNIRPLTLIVLTAGFLVLVFMSTSMRIQTPDKLLELYSSLLTGVYFFYFGGRSLEKISGMTLKLLKGKLE
jgi:hypothetical protein